MTTTANKHGLRAAYAVRTRKHAQRTPLPPRTTTDHEETAVSAVRKTAERPTVEVATFGPNIPFKDGTFHVHAVGCADLKKRIYTSVNAKAHSDVSEVESLDDLVASIYPPSDFEYNLSDPEDSAPYRDDVIVMPCVVWPAPKKPARTRKAAPKAAKPVAVELGSKAEAFVAFATEVGGWDVATEHKGDCDIVTVTRGEETITVTLVNNKQDAIAPPLYQVGARVVKLRNTSAVRTQMTADPEERPIKERVVPARKSRVNDDEVIVKARLPFDIELGGDQAILDAIAGKKVTWRSSFSDQFAEERVPDNSRTLRIDPHNAKSGASNRIITFIGATGYVSVRLSNIVRVSR